MDDKDYYILGVFLLFILYDLYTFINQDKEWDRIYRKTVEDTTWNTSRSQT